MTAVNTTAWLSRDLVSVLLREGALHFPEETGGILIGYWGDDEGDVVAVETIGPGPGAVHTPYSFAPDYDYQDAEVARIYRESRGSLTYLGDWHSHGAAPPYLSSKDKRTLHEIANDPDSCAPRALMVVLGAGPEWELRVWRYRNLPFRNMTYRWAPAQCTVRIFDL